MTTETKPQTARLMAAPDLARDLAEARAQVEHWQLRHGEAARTAAAFQDEAIALRAQVAELAGALRELLAASTPSNHAGTNAAKDTARALLTRIAQ